MSLFGDGGGAVVADVWRQRCNQHQRALQVLVNPLAVRLRAAQAVQVEAVHGVCQQSNALNDIVNDQRFERIQLQVSLHAANTDGGVIAHHLCAHHAQCLALGRVDLAGHDG